MSLAAIQAGKAWVEMAIKDKTDAGLSAVQKKLMRWGLKLGAVGAGIKLVGAGILGALTGVAEHAAAAGSHLQDMSDATGVSAESLSALKYAAGQNGAELADVGAAMKGMAKITGALAKGNKQATQTFDTLGISTQAFLQADPESRLGMIADALSRVEDPGLRAAFAMKTLGKGGVALLPTLKDGAAGLKQLTDRARELGITISDAEAAKLDRLDDQWTELKSVWSAIGTRIGVALADTLTAVWGAVTNVLSGVVAFIKENQGLVVTLFGVAAAVTLVGGVLLGLGAATILITAAIAGIVTAVGFLLTPLGILTALGVALVAGAIYWLAFTNSGQAAMRDLWSVVGPTLNGMFNAIASNRWQLAGDIMWAAIELGWVAGIYSLKSLWIDFQAWLLNRFADVLSGAGQFGTAIAAALGSVGLPDAGIAGGAHAASAAAAGLHGAADTAQSAASIAAAGKVIEAAARLGALLAQAQQARDNARPKQTPLSFAGLSSPSEAGFAAGAFNSAAASMLGNTAESPHERTAKAAEAALGKLDDIHDAIEDLDLADTD